MKSNRLHYNTQDSAKKFISKNFVPQSWQIFRWPTFMSFTMFNSVSEVRQNYVTNQSGAPGQRGLDWFRLLKSRSLNYIMSPSCMRHLGKERKHNPKRFPFFFLGLNCSPNAISWSLLCIPTGLIYSPAWTDEVQHGTGITYERQCGRVFGALIM